MRRPSSDLSEPSRNLEESRGPAGPSSPSVPAMEADRDRDMEMSAAALDEPDPIETDVGVDEGSTLTPVVDRIYTPPPHIAARFYRPSTNRRKGSAASSRRGSISSVHSRSSHGCASAPGELMGGGGGGGGSGVGARGASVTAPRGEGPQSKHVAQHLRRASILEDRRARLADRAAHAEKVRLRAAIAKAAAQRSNTSASEERALAAAAAREKNLAEIAAACAGEVRRAKAVAELMREKREQAVRAMREQLEERQAEAERRREELRSRAGSTSGRGNSGSGIAAGTTNGPSRSRAQSLVLPRKQGVVEILPQLKERRERETTPPPPDEAATDEAAAGRIQWWWRARTRGLAIGEFRNLGLTVDKIREQSFLTVMSLLSQDNVLLATAKVLRICGLEEGDPGSAEEMLAVRTFLSAILILGHPSPVLDNKNDIGEAGDDGDLQLQPAGPSQPRLPPTDLANPQLQDLVAKAQDLLGSFEGIMSRLSTSNSFTPSPALKKALPEIYATFYHAFIAWKARDSKALIEVMLMQFVELDAILQTVKNSTEKAVEEHYLESIKENQLNLMVRIKRLGGPEKGRKMIFDAVREARKSRAAALSKKPVGDVRPRTVEQDQADLAKAAAAMSDEQIQLHLPSIEAPSSNAATTSLISPLIPANRLVVHELSISPDYRFDVTEWKEARNRMVQSFLSVVRQRGGWEELSGRARQHAFDVFLRSIDMMRTNLQRLVSPGNSTYNLIADMLDTELIQREMLAGTYNFDKPFQSLTMLLPKLCAPFRDAELKELIEVGFAAEDVADRLAAAFDFLDLMIADYASYRLSVAAPKLIESGPAYEYKAFHGALTRRTHGLDAAEAAWRTARNKVLAEARRRDPEGVNHPRFRAAYSSDKMYAQMLVDVFTLPAPIPERAMPEMLRLDRGRAHRLGALALRIAVTGAVLLQCKNLLKRDVRAPWKQEASRILTVLATAEATAAANASATRDKETADPAAAAGRALAYGDLLASTAHAAPPMPIQAANIDAMVAMLERRGSVPHGMSRAAVREVVTRLVAVAAAAKSGDTADDDVDVSAIAAAAADLFARSTTGRTKAAAKTVDASGASPSSSTSGIFTPSSTTSTSPKPTSRHRAGPSPPPAHMYIQSNPFSPAAKDSVALPPLPHRFDSPAAVDGVMAALDRCMPSATRDHLRSFVARFLSAASDAATQPIPAQPPWVPVFPTTNAGPSPSKTPASESQEPPLVAAPTVPVTGPGIVDPAEPVLRLLLSRVRAHIFGRLALSSGASSSSSSSSAGGGGAARATTTAEKLAGLGLPEFVDQLGAVVDELLKVAAVDKAAHAGWWEEVAEKCNEADGGALAGGA